jgi:predicted phosphodiesterase
MKRNTLICLILIFIIPFTLYPSGNGSEDTFIILHLSDFHFTSPDSFDDKMENEKNRQQKILDALLEAVGNDKIKPDVVVLSGDIVYGRDNRPETYQWVKKALTDSLVEKISTIEPDELFIVPGNHDVMRNKIDMNLLLNNRETVSGFLWEVQLLLYQQMENELYRQRLLKGMTNFSQYSAKYPGQKPVPEKIEITQDNPLVPFVNIVKDGKKSIALVGLNSSYFSKISPDLGIVALGEYQVKKAYEVLVNRAKKQNIRQVDLVINVFHHPLDQLWQHDTWQINQKKYFNNSIILSGHLHHVKQTHYCDPFEKSDIYEFQAGAVYLQSYRMESETLRYQYVTVNWKKKEITLNFRRYDESKGKWLPDGNKKFSGLPAPHQVNTSNTHRLL